MPSAPLAPAECWSTVKKPIILLSVLLVLALATVLIVPAFVNWDRYKDQVSERIGTATGLRVAIDGEMDLALLPRPTFKASGVRIADLSSVVTPDMARVATSRLSISTSPNRVSSRSSEMNTNLESSLQAKAAT